MMARGIPTERPRRASRVVLTGGTQLFMTLCYGRDSPTLFTRTAHIEAGPKQD